MPDKQRRVEAKCPLCHKIDSFEAPESGFSLRGKGSSLSRSFPDLPADRIIQLATGVCPECQVAKR